MQGAKMNKKLATIIFCSFLAQYSFAETPTTESAAKPATDAAKPAAPDVIDCEYKVTMPIEQLPSATLLKWSENAALETFSLNYKSLDNQLSKIKSCFTKQGWESFNQALKKSGNLDAIKKQQLSMSAKVDGKPEITDQQEKSWKVTIPLAVTYQNSQKQMVQKLIIDLMVGVKISGDLGINQVVAQSSNDKLKQEQQKQDNANTANEDTAQQEQESQQNKQNN